MEEKGVTEEDRRKRRGGRGFKDGGGDEDVWTMDRGGRIGH